MNGGWVSGGRRKPMSRSTHETQGNVNMLQNSSCMAHNTQIVHHAACAQSNRKRRRRYRRGALKNFIQHRNSPVTDVRPRPGLGTRQRRPNDGQKSIIVDIRISSGRHTFLGRTGVFPSRTTLMYKCHTKRQPPLVTPKGTLEFLK